jgi:hypothetical protein
LVLQVLLAGSVPAGFVVCVVDVPSARVVVTTTVPSSDVVVQTESPVAESVTQLVVDGDGVGAAVVVTHLLADLVVLQ